MRIHFIGCEGASMKVLRKLSEANGAQTSGSDSALNGHDEKFVYGADTVVYSSAIPQNNPELTYAREHGLQVMSRAEYLGQISSQYSLTVAVAGSHGKTTTTAMLGCIFAPHNPTVHLGGEYGGECGHVGGKRFFITEACEYRRNFLHILPKISVVLNVELDHTDYYRDIADITSAFEVFSRSAPVRIVNGDDEASAPLRKGKYITFGLSERCEFRAVNITPFRGGIAFFATRAGKPLGEIRLKVMGRHNVLNAVAAIAASAAAGLPFSEIKRGLESFTGVGRRLEYLGTSGNADVFSDYAHHPHEIQSMLECLRESGYSRIAVAFEPHTYSRTESLLNEFADSLMLADDILLADVYAAREAPKKGVSSQLLCRKILDCGRYARCYPTFFELNEAAAALAEKASVIVFCGAGTIDIAARRFME